MDGEGGGYVFYLRWLKPEQLLMKRRDFLSIGSLAALGATLPAFSQNIPGPLPGMPFATGRARNIIFLVSDGMSPGTLTMADIMLRRTQGRGSHWLNLYRQRKAFRAMVDTSAADSLVTDSAAGASAWGCGVKVKNGALNIGPDGTAYKPILRKFQERGKAVGCVTTVPITHATPAGFSVSTKSRNDQQLIADLYLDLRYDVMMGGGLEFFSADKRKDKKDMFAVYAEKGYQVPRDRQAMQQCRPGTPVMGVFYEDGFPYTVDRLDSDPAPGVPTLAEMTRKAIEIMSVHPGGFVLQVEGGKVDWAAHVNDVGALLYDQIAFDDAVGVALEFASRRTDTLVIMTSDHGNANPGLVKNSRADAMFDLIPKFRHSYEWVLYGLALQDAPQKVIDRVREATGVTLKVPEAEQILAGYEGAGTPGNYTDKKLPFRLLGQLMQNYTSIGWVGMDHTADFVELGMFGPGSEMLPPLVQNNDLHSFMLAAAGI